MKIFQKKWKSKKLDKKIEEEVPYDAFDVACHIVNYCNDNHYSITYLKLHKLLFVLQGLWLATYEKPLFKEDIYAYSFGPGIPMVTEVFRVFGNSPCRKVERVLEADYLPKTFPTLYEEVIQEGRYYPYVYGLGIDGGQPYIDKIRPEDQIFIHMVCDFCRNMNLTQWLELVKKFPCYTETEVQGNGHWKILHKDMQRDFSKFLEG